MEVDALHAHEASHRAAKMLNALQYRAQARTLEGACTSCLSITHLPNHSKTPLMALRVKLAYTHFSHGDAECMPAALR